MRLIARLRSRRATAGSNGNIPLLEQSHLNIGLVAGEPAYEAFSGIGRPKTDLKSVTADPSGRQLPRPDHTDLFRGLVEFRAGAGEAARRCYLANLASRALHGAEGTLRQTLPRACEPPPPVAVAPDVALISP